MTIYALVHEYHENNHRVTAVWNFADITAALSEAYTLMQRRHLTFSVPSSQDIKDGCLFTTFPGAGEQVYILETTLGEGPACPE